MRSPANSKHANKNSTCAMVKTSDTEPTSPKKKDSTLPLHAPATRNFDHGPPRGEVQRHQARDGLASRRRNQLETAAASSPELWKLSVNCRALVGCAYCNAGNLHTRSWRCAKQT